MKRTAIELAAIHVDYPLGLALVSGLLRRVPKPAEYKRALAGIDLRIFEGERVGIIGPNGAGKSTLLRIIAGILPPTSGCVRVFGSVASLFEFATGFEMERTGLENIKIRGLLQGLSAAQIAARLNEIAAFSELGPALTQPVRTYSTGMFVRLAFSAATAIDPDILLIDEAFGAGDEHFAHKAQDRMLQLIRRGRALVFTSHNMGLVEQLCTRCIWLDAGLIRADGSTGDVIEQYRRSVDE